MAETSTIENLEARLARADAEIAALRESEERYRAVFESIDEGVVTFDVIFDADAKAIDAIYVETNAALGRMTGLTIDIVGKRMREVLPNLEPFWFDTFGRVIATGEPTRFQYTVHDLEDQWFDVFATRVGGEGSSRIVLVYNNITDRKRAEAALRENEARDRLLVGTWAQAVWETDAAGVVVKDSPSWRAYTGQTIEDWLGYGWLHAVHPDDRAYAERQWRDALAVAGLVNAEFRLRAPDGAWRWTNVRAVPVLDERGTIEKWAGMNIDIDARKRAEARLRESEERYRTVWERIDEGFCVVEPIHDADGNATDYRIIEVNPAFQRQTGLTDVVGRLDSEVAGTEPRWIQLYAEVARTGESRRLQDFHEPTGRWYDVHVGRLGDASKPRVSIVFTDITSRKKAEAALRGSEERQTFLLELSDLIRPMRDAMEIQRAAVQRLGEHLNVSRSGYYEVEADQNTFFLTARWEQETVPLPDRMLLSDFGEDIREGYRAGRTMVTRDTEQEAASEENLAAVRAIRVRAWIGVPLVKDGRWVAAVGVHSAVARDWTASEIQLVEEVGERTWAAVERARAEEKLRESELRFRTLADTAPAFIWFNDEVGANVFVNQAFLDYTGRSAAQVAGDRWHGLLHPDQEQAYVASYLDAVRTQTPWRGRNLLRRADGVWHWCDNYAKPLFRDDGSYRGHVGVLIDVDDKVRAEEALFESEERQAFLLKLSDALRPLANADRVVAEATRLLGDNLQADRTFIAEIEPDGVNVHVHEEYLRSGAPSVIGHHNFDMFGTFVTRELTRGEILAVEDVSALTNLAETERAHYAFIGIAAYLLVPLVRDGRLAACLTVNHRTAHPWTEADKGIARQTADRTWAAVERARAEAALQASEALRRVALEGGGMGTWRWSLEDRLVWGDAKFMALWGFPASDEPQPLSFFTARMSPEGAREMERIVTEAIAAGEEFDGPLEIIAGPTAGHWIRWRGQADKGTASNLYGVTFDITEQRKAERALRESEERFAQFAAASAAALWIRDADTLNLEFTSHAIETIYGIEPGAILGDEKRWAALVVPDDRDVALGHIETARRGEAVVHEFRIQRPSDGAFRWVRDTDFPLYDAHGRVQRIGGIAEDVTEAKLAAEHQDVLLAELQHRVRNILALTRSIVARTGERARSVSEYAELILGRLLAFARVQALLTRAANVSVGVASIVRDEVGVQASHEGQYVLAGPDIELSPKAAEVLTLAVHELATNALKYGALSVPDGKVAVTWSTFETRGGMWLSFDWTEEGAPERPAAAAATPRPRGFGSELIEGRVPYELKGSGSISIEPGGARCHLQFPLTQGASVLETGAPQKATVFGGALDMTGEADLGGCRVLVVEDDYYLATDAARALQGAGAEVIALCSTEADARRELEKRRPDAVVLDVNLGSGANFKLAELLKDNGIPFVFVTGYDQEVIPAEFAGVERLEKPIQLRQIVGAVFKLVTPPE